MVVFLFIQQCLYCI